MWWRSTGRYDGLICPALRTMVRSAENIAAPDKVVHGHGLQQPQKYLPGMWSEAVAGLGNWPILWAWERRSQLGHSGAAAFCSTVAADPHSSLWWPLEPRRPTAGVRGHPFTGTLAMTRPQSTRLEVFRWWAFCCRMTILLGILLFLMSVAVYWLLGF